jgi:hypothetical protein
MQITTQNGIRINLLYPAAALCILFVIPVYEAAQIAAILTWGMIAVFLVLSVTVTLMLVEGHKITPHEDKKWWDRIVTVASIIPYLLLSILAIRNGYTVTGSVFGAIVLMVYFMLFVIALNARR